MDKTITIHDVINFIQNPALLDDDRRRIIAVLNNATRAARAEAKIGLQAGQRVTFFSTRLYRHVTGYIVKVNRVNVDVRESETGTMWRVAPQFLTHC